jgi:hypothetical protein
VPSPGSRFDAAVCFAINGEPANWRRSHGDRNADPLCVSRR